ncbi:MAG: peptidylprolyl isomerase [Fluviicola sp.]
MRFVFLHILFLFIASGSYAQDYLSKAKEIRNIEQAQLFADSLPQVVFGFLHDKMPNEDYQSRKDNLKPGDSYVSDSYHVVVVAEGAKEIYRFRLLTMTTRNTPNAKEEIRDVFEQLNAGTSFEDLFERHAQNSGPDKEVFGDAGWVDLDFFVEPFQKAVRGKSKGDQFIAGDEKSGWFNIVDMTHKPKKIKGHYVLLIPKANPNDYFSNVNHHKNISKLKSPEEMRRYAKKYPGDVMLELLYDENEPELYSTFLEQRKTQTKEELGIVEKDQRSYKFMRDTTLELYSIQYVYLDGSAMSREERTAAIHDIYDQFHANVPFDSIVEQYWPDNNGFSTLRNIDGGILAADLVEKVKTTTVGQLFVARVSQSYFIGVPLEKPKKRPAVLVLSYPNTSQE